MILKCVVILTVLSTMGAIDLHGFGTVSNSLYPYPEECSALLDAFAEAAASLTMCAIKNARPIRLCENCISDYIDFHKGYDKFLNTVLNGTKCGTYFLSKDRLNAIVEYHDNILAIWSNGNCNDCFTWTSNGPQLSNKTSKFNHMFDTTMQCIVTNSNLDDSQKICEKCMESYVNLDEFYKSLSADHIGIDYVCMDVVDSMNATRSIWSKELNCCRLRKSPEIIFLCCTGLISLLPVLFYLAVRYCGPIRDLPNVLRQSRFKQTLLRSGRATERN